MAAKRRSRRSEPPRTGHLAAGCPADRWQRTDVPPDLLVIGSRLLPFCPIRLEVDHESLKFSVGIRSHVASGMEQREHNGRSTCHASRTLHGMERWRPRWERVAAVGSLLRCRIFQSRLRETAGRFGQAVGVFHAREAWRWLREDSATTGQATRGTLLLRPRHRENEKSDYRDSSVRTLLSRRTAPESA